MPSVIYADCHSAECAECRYAECHYAECRGSKSSEADFEVVCERLLNKLDMSCGWDGYELLWCS